MTVSIIVGSVNAVFIFLDAPAKDPGIYLTPLLLPLFYGMTSAAMHLAIIWKPLVNVVKNRDRKSAGLSSSYRAIEVLVLAIVAIVSFVLTTI